MINNIFVYLTFLIEFLPIAFFYFIILFLLYLYIKDRTQKQHSVLRTHPVIGRLRYLMEMVGEEFRQYFFYSNRENKPVDRDTQSAIAKAGKYGSTVIGFGSKKDFAQPDFYLANSMFPKNVEELRVDNETATPTFLYKILQETLTNRHEKRYSTSLQPWLLKKEDSIVIGETCSQPFSVRGFIGISAMSYGALSKSAVKALAQGVAISGGSYMNTGEGGISPYHLSKVYTIKNDNAPTDILLVDIYSFISQHQQPSNFDISDKFGDSIEIMLALSTLVTQEYISVHSPDLIFQVGSGLYGAKKDGLYSEETFSENAQRPEVKAIEIKLAQGAKVRGGKLPKEKITPEIAEIRGIPMGQDVESPNRFPLFDDLDGLFALIKRWRYISGGKPVGIKVVAGSEASFVELAIKMKETNEGPDFISIDGGEGGTGATYQEMADTLGLPLYPSLSILNQTLINHGVRERVKIIASGTLFTADKMAIALSMGADLINTARGAMNALGCLNSFACSKNTCPVGITTHQPQLEKGLVVDEKRYRVANYLTTMRQGLFMLGASCGIDNPTKFESSHVTFRERNNKTTNLGIK